MAGGKGNDSRQAVVRQPETQHPDARQGADQDEYIVAAYLVTTDAGKQTAEQCARVENRQYVASKGGTHASAESLHRQT